MAEQEPLNTQGNQNNIDIDKQRILQEAKEYSEKQMKILKSKKTHNVYIIVSIIFIIVIISAYLFAIFHRDNMFTQMGL
ncbi:MAG: hypothetical protein WCS83_01775 [Endomicrobiia bacterium]|nr:hypothetical protein [Endomicrobiaceae bacterium]MDD3922025.1 hypothetical protein [Endomicrobiaceae bacterium]